MGLLTLKLQVNDKKEARDDDGIVFHQIRLLQKEVMQLGFRFDFFEGGIRANERNQLLPVILTHNLQTWPESLWSNDGLGKRSRKKASTWWEKKISRISESPTHKLDANQLLNYVLLLTKICKPQRIVSGFGISSRRI